MTTQQRLHRHHQRCTGLVDWKPVSSALAYTLLPRPSSQPLPPFHLGVENRPAYLFDMFLYKEEHSRTHDKISRSRSYILHRSPFLSIQFTASLNYV